MSEAGKAVFLSYASQDAEAVARLAGALRATGLEVWFDKDELAGGDAWDAKIRGQIAACALFVPVISAATQARLEGYFRLEWKLAAQRTHTMADEKTFLLPVVIDDTRETEAKVPAEFKAVQWTKLPGGETPPRFCERVQKLLGGGGAPVSGRGLGADGAGDVNADAGQRPAHLRKNAWWPRLAGGALVLLAVGTTLFFALRPRHTGAGAKPAGEVASAAVVPPSKAQQLVTQARALYEPWDFATADDFKLAERLLKEAAELEPVNADAYAALAIVSYGQQVFGFDRSAARDALLRSARGSSRRSPISRNWRSRCFTGGVRAPMTRRCGCSAHWRSAGARTNSSCANWAASSRRRNATRRRSRASIARPRCRVATRSR